MNLAGRERLAAVENVKKVGGCCSCWASLSIRPEGAYPISIPSVSDPAATNEVSGTLETSYSSYWQKSPSGAEP